MKNFEQYFIIKALVRWTFLILPVSAAIGITVSLFLWLLNYFIHVRFNHPWLLFLLPLAGILIWSAYTYAGKYAEKGNNLIIDEIHQAGSGIPKRMAPLILISTLITHLFGGSAGREGTAVQIGGSIAAMFGRWYGLDENETKMILMAGIAAGFGAVFGTPLTGAIFALEVVAIGSIQYSALIPSLAASVIANITVGIFGLHHTVYRIDTLPKKALLYPQWLHADLLLFIKVILAGIIFGLSSYLFSVLMRNFKTLFGKLIRFKFLIPAAGGVLIILFTLINGKQDYLSLGIDSQQYGAVTIPSAFNEGGADTWSWFWKMLYTTVTLSSGFKGGEVTPLFYIGATLGNTLSQPMDTSASLFAALGFIAVFAGATNTPIACTFMGIELFGGQHALLFAIVCFTSYIFSGQSGIYSSQKVAVPKFEGLVGEQAEANFKNRQEYLKIKFGRYKI